MQSHIATMFHPLKRTWLARATFGLLAASAFAMAPHAEARVFVSVNIAPPLLPVYEQPPIPGAGYLWTPGYWAYAEDGGYYWVPGTWVRAPYVGALWTPGYWGWRENAYVFHVGYWGRHVGYYGGINYGYGYGGSGYNGGYWGHGRFRYNTAFNRIGNVRITNVYNRTVINHVTVNRYSFNGPGGANYRPTAHELAFSRERRSGPVGDQIRQRELASHNESLRASVNHGAPPILATPRAGAFERASDRKTAAPGSNGAAHANAHAAFGQKTAATARTLGKDSAARTRFGAEQSAAAKAKQKPKYRSTHAMRNDRAASRAANRQSENRNTHFQAQRERPVVHSGGQRPNSGMRGGTAHQGQPRGGGQHPRGGKPDHHEQGGR